MRHFLANSFPDYSYCLGYYQNLAYIKEIETKLRQDFRLKTPLSEQNLAVQKRIKSAPNSICLHIRRGDYLLLEDSFIALGAGYYNAALAFMRERLGAGASVFVFSNDIEWCCAKLEKLLNFGGMSVEFVRGNGEADAAAELELMRSCEHFIIANSSFSWWAAFLAESSAKLVTMPERFLRDRTALPHGNMLKDANYIMIEHVFGEVV